MRLKALISLISQEPTGFGMPCPGQCLNVGIDGRTHAAIILVSTKNAVVSVWPNECNLGKVHAHAKDLDEFNVGPSEDRR